MDTGFFHTLMFVSGLDVTAICSAQFKPSVNSLPLGVADSGYATGLMNRVKLSCVPRDSDTLGSPADRAVFSTYRW